MTHRHQGVFEVTVPEPPDPFRITGSKSAYVRTASPQAAGRPVPAPADDRRARPAPDRRGHGTSSCGGRSARGRRRRGRPAPRSPSGRRTRAASGVIGDFNFWDGRAHPDALARRRRGVGAVRAGRRPGRQVQVLDLRAGRRVAGEGRPDGAARRDAARHRVGRLRVGVRVGRRGLAGRARRAAAADQRDVASTRCTSGSWRPGLSYRELAGELAAYVTDMGFTHVEFLPVAEHPFGGSWGYQVTSYYAPTSRFGTPDDFRFLVDTLHQAGIGVIVDWVPAHFPRDSWALAEFDGTPLYEHSDPRLGVAPGLGHARVQLRPLRGAQLPRRQRHLLARGVPHRRPAGRRGRVDALPRLLAQGRRVDAERRTAAGRTSTRSRSSRRSTPPATSGCRGS